MSKSMKGRKKRIMFIVIGIVLCAALVLGGLMIYGKIQMGKVPGLTFEDALNHTYEIGSLTKTMTAALVSKAVGEGLISPDAAIDTYLSLPAGKNYPTVAELLTHTSGYNGFYFETPMIGNFFSGKNSFFGISREMVLAKCKSLDMNKDSYSFTYSNYGYAVLGLVLEAVYEKDYTALLNGFVQEELGMTATKISEHDGDLDNYWDWQENDGYLSAGAVTSNIEDMLHYAQLQLEDNPVFTRCHQSLKTINAASESHKMMGIRLDEIGMAWIKDQENGFIWHNGGTGHYNSYLGFCPETGTAGRERAVREPDQRPACAKGDAVPNVR